MWLLQDEEKAKEMLSAFQEFFGDPTVKKVWHNYSFDRHVLENHHVLGPQGQESKLELRGLGGDTMHMARLWDSSRTGTKNYSLASLTKCAFNHTIAGICVFYCP